MRESEVFLMRNTKRELNPYSFYDTEGLARHFERMAAEGWAPDRVGLFIRYRRIKPQKLRFAVAFYPDSDDTPEGRMCSSTTVNKRAGSTLWARER